jgi:hypothetical protein
MRRLILILSLASCTPAPPEHAAPDGGPVPHEIPPPSPMRAFRDGGMPKHPLCRPPWSHKCWDAGPDTK